jgi:hypothetical protein
METRTTKRETGKGGNEYAGIFLAQINLSVCTPGGCLTLAFHIQCSTLKNQNYEKAGNYCPSNGRNRL